MNLGLKNREAKGRVIKNKAARTGLRDPVELTFKFGVVAWEVDCC